jgi:hypothetical protein
MAILKAGCEQMEASVIVKIDVSQERMGVRMDVHHKRMLAMLDSQVGKMEGVVMSLMKD